LLLPEVCAIVVDELFILKLITVEMMLTITTEVILLQNAWKHAVTNYMLLIAFFCIEYKEMFIFIISYTNTLTLLDVLPCTDSLSAKNVGELYTGFVSCTWNICGRQASCVITVGHAMAQSGLKTNLSPDVSFHAIVSKAHVLGHSV